MYGILSFLLMTVTIDCRVESAWMEEYLTILGHYVQLHHLIRCTYMHRTCVCARFARNQPGGGFVRLWRSKLQRLRTMPRRRETFNPRPTETTAKSYRVSAQSARGDLRARECLRSASLARAGTRRTDCAFERVRGGLWHFGPWRARAANRVRKRPIKLNVPAARLTLKNGTSSLAPS